ncbi:pheophorbide A oxygenase, putative [Ricinus communis]|uniref:Pheophorbide A oxygenase, putative n=1 Tax=Ricinus communis TaxID=3988 RepID=B9SM65_RICCO|nr:pheophorbide A oxygenase, putative [Ricinus communis]
MDRYWSHMVNCSSCNAVYKGLNALQALLQIVSIASLGIVAATKEGTLSAVTRISLASMAATLCGLLVMTWVLYCLRNLSSEIGMLQSYGAKWIEQD